MAKLVLDTIAKYDEISKINSNFDKIETEFQNKVLYRDNPVGEANTLAGDVDCNGKNLYNVNEVRASDLLIDGVNITQSVVASQTAAAASATAAASSATSAASSASASATSASQAASSAASVVPEIANYTAIRAYTGPVTVYYVRGVADLFDGGHGVFRVDAGDTTSADNGGTILVDAAGRRWKREFSGAVNVRWFGAKGDGATNDTSAIQSALNAVLSGGGLFFPQGSYRIYTKIVATDAANVKVVGSKATILKDASFDFTGGSNATFHFIDSTDIEIASLTFQGVETSTTAPLWGDDGVLFNSCRRATVRDCRFVNFGDSAVRATTIFNVEPVPSVVDTTDVLVNSSMFENCMQTSTTAGGAARIVFDGNIFTNLKGAVKFASRVAGSGQTVFTNNVISTSKGNGVEAVSITGLIVSGNTFTDITALAVQIYTNDTAEIPANPWGNITIADNIVKNAGQAVRVSAAAYADGTYVLVPNILISGNTFDTCTAASGAAVVLKGALANVHVNNNVLSGVTYRAVYLALAGRDALTTSDDVQISNNIFKNIGGQWLYIENGTGALRKAKNVTIDGNVCNASAGFAIYSVTDLTLSNNSSVSNAQSFLGASGLTVDSVRVAGNSFRSSGQGVNSAIVGGQIYDNTFDAVTSFSLRTDLASSALEERDNRYLGIAPVWNVVPSGYASLGANITTTGTAAPTTGTWRRGDVIVNTQPSASGNFGWVCTTAGTPGTWKTFGTIAA